MKVKELLELLEGVDPEMDVIGFFSDVDVQFAYIMPNRAQVEVLAEFEEGHEANSLLEKETWYTDKDYIWEQYSDALYMRCMEEEDIEAEADRLLEMTNYRNIFVIDFE